MAQVRVPVESIDISPQMLFQHCFLSTYDEFNRSCIQSCGTSRLFRLDWKMDKPAAALAPPEYSEALRETDRPVSVGTEAAGKV